MATNFTVILFQRQHFGNEPGTFNDVEPNVPFAGAVESRSLRLPERDSSEAAFLMFQSRDVDHPRNMFQVNGIGVFGGLPASPAREAGTATSCYRTAPPVESGGQRPPCRSSRLARQGGGNIDDFIIDNVVIVYKTPDAVTLPSVTGDLAAFIKTELVPSIANVKGSGASADPADQHNEYVLPTASQLGSWRVVFRSLLAGAGPMHTSRPKPSVPPTTSSGSSTHLLQRTYFVLMEGLPGRDPRAGRPSVERHYRQSGGSVASRLGNLRLRSARRGARSASRHRTRTDDLDTAEQAADAYLGLQARTLLIAGADRDQNTARASCEQSSRPYLEADVAHTSESVFQVAFEEIYSSDVFTWHIQFHGNATCADDVFVSNGVLGGACRFSRRSPRISGPRRRPGRGRARAHRRRLRQPSDCRRAARTTCRCASRRACHTRSICAPGNVPIGPSRFIHVEQRRDARRAPTDSAATPGRNRDVVTAAIGATFP